MRHRHSFVVLAKGLASLWGSRWGLLCLACVVGVLAVQLGCSVGAVQEEGVQARSVNEFVDSIGVDTSIHYTTTSYGRSELVRDKMVELGAKHVREAAVETDFPEFDNNVYAIAKTLADEGIKFNLVFDPRTDPDAAMIDRLQAAYSNSVVAFEGPNEHDLTGGDWVNEVRAFQQDLYDAVQASSSADVPVIAPSFARAPESYDAAGDFTGMADYPNIHRYFSARHVGSPGWGADGYGSTEWLLRQTDKQLPGVMPYVTETGNNTAVNHEPYPDVPEEVAGKYTPRVMLEHFRVGIPRSYIYELVDLEEDPEQDDPLLNWGLLRHDFSEKPAFEALRDTLKVVQNSGGGTPAQPEALSYSLWGDTADVREVLMQAEDGTYYLVLWLEKASWDPINYVPINVPEQNVTVNLPQGSSGELYRPLTHGTTATSNFAGSANVSVPDHPTIVKIDAGSGPTPTTDRIEDDDPQVTYEGSWGSYPVSYASEGNLRSTEGPATARVAFEGTGISWISSKNPWSGKAEVYLDGAYQETVDLYDPADQGRQVSVYVKSGLSGGPHTLEIGALGQKNAASSDTWVDVDAFDVTDEAPPGGPPGGTTRVEGDGTGTSYSPSGDWGSYAVSYASGGNVKSSFAAYSTARLAFSGTAVTLVAGKNPWSGKADIYVDGAFQETYDFYDATEQGQVPVYTKSGLSVGSHEIEVRIRSDRNPASWDNWVDVDAFDVTDSTSSW